MESKSFVSLETKREISILDYIVTIKLYCNLEPYSEYEKYVLTQSINMDGSLIGFNLCFKEKEKANSAFSNYSHKEAQSFYQKCLMIKNSKSYGK